MSKSFDIVMAGLISGIVALTTGFLGVAGTVIGAVLGAILYQLLSIFVKKPLESSTIRRVENELVYMVPLVLIAIFLSIFIVALLHSYMMISYDFLEFFRQLEELTINNLVRFMGIGLVAMGTYPLIQSKIIEKKYGFAIFISGIILLIRGLLDLNIEFFYFYSEVFQSFDILLMLCILLTLSFIIIKMFAESITLYMNKKNSNNLTGPIVNENVNINDNLKVAKANIKNKREYFEGHDQQLVNFDKKHEINPKNKINPTKNNNIRENIEMSHSEIDKINKDNKANKTNNTNKINKINNKSQDRINDNKNKNNNKKGSRINNEGSYNTIKINKTSTMNKNRKYFK